jgi:hypothetical protein
LVPRRATGWGKGATDFYCIGCVQKRKANAHTHYRLYQAYGVRKNLWHRELLQVIIYFCPQVHATTFVLNQREFEAWRSYGVSNGKQQVS